MSKKIEHPHPRPPFFEPLTYNEAEKLKQLLWLQQRNTITSKEVSQLTRLKRKQELAEHPSSRLKYVVLTFRLRGFEAKWSRTSSRAPIIVARLTGSDQRTSRETWWAVTGDMWREMNMNPTLAGIAETFERFTLLGDVFSIPV